MWAASIARSLTLLNCTWIRYSAETRIRRLCPFFGSSRAHRWLLRLWPGFRGAGPRSGSHSCPKSYWELKYQQGELRVRVQRMSRRGAASASSRLPHPEQPPDNFVPLSSLAPHRAGVRGGEPAKRWRPLCQVHMMSSSSVRVPVAMSPRFVRPNSGRRLCRRREAAVARRHLPDLGVYSHQGVARARARLPDHKKRQRLGRRLAIRRSGHRHASGACAQGQGRQRPDEGHRVSLQEAQD